MCGTKSLVEKSGTLQLLHMNWKLFAFAGRLILTCDKLLLSAYGGILYSEEFVLGLSITSDVLTEVLRIGVGPLICCFKANGLYFGFLLMLFA